MSEPNTAPPAPFVGPSRNDVIARLRAKDLSRNTVITLGKYEPQAEIRFQNDSWVLIKLATSKQDQKTADLNGQKRLSEGENYPA